MLWEADIVPKYNEWLISQDALKKAKARVK